MSHKLNCWEFSNCGMEPDGIFAKIYGEPCPVAIMRKLDGVNGGIAGGRACWLITEKKGRLACHNSEISCFHCQFYKRIINEDENASAVILPRLNEAVY